MITHAAGDCWGDRVVGGRLMPNTAFGLVESLDAGTEVASKLQQKP
jgi:hypothetical protein